MRWTLAVAGVTIAGAVALSQGPIRSLLGEPARGELPELRVERSDLEESAIAIGTIRAKVGAEVKVGSRLSGVVSELNVEVGDRVTKGERLASLADADWRARVEVLRAQLASAEAEEGYAETELARTERLGELVPALELERVRRNLDVQRAGVRRARAALREAEINLGYTVIAAPVSGTIASVSTYRGETIAASLAAPTFVTIIDLDRLEVQCFVDETDIGRIAEGQPVTIRIDSFPGSELQGTVQAIHPKAQLVNNVVNYVVIVAIADRQGLALRPEMTVHVQFVLERKEGVLAIPRGAVLRREGRSFVIVREAGRWTERPVRTGLQTPQSVEIVSGLKPGETILADRNAWNATKEENR